jgi:hypothetical protein
MEQMEWREAVAEARWPAIWTNWSSLHHRVKQRMRSLRAVGVLLDDQSRLLAQAADRVRR